MDAATSALIAGFTEIASSVTGVITSTLPIALGVLGLVIAVRFGVRWFRSLVR